MQLSNNYINRFNKLSSNNLNESKTDIIVNKIGLPEEIAKLIEFKYGKYSIWFANVFMNDFNEFIEKGLIVYNNNIIDKNKFKELILSKDKEFIEYIKDEYLRHEDTYYDYIFDWLQGRNSGTVIENDKINFKDLTLSQALNRSRKWHRELEKIQGGQIKDESGDVIITFPDGYYWIKLNSSVCNDESKAMGHCGRGSGILFSLRKDKYPFVTADILENGEIKQMRGRANTKPKSTFHKYILDFLFSNNVDHFNYNGYNPKDNFWLEDLENENDINKIIKNKPQLLKNQNLSFLTKEQMLEVSKEIPEILPISKYFDNNLEINNVKNKISDLKWWNYELNERKYDSYIPNKLQELLSSFYKSGKIFYDLLLDEMLNNLELNNFLFFNNNGDINEKINYIQSNSEIIKNALGDRGVKILDDLYLKNKNVLKLYWDYNLFDYIKFIKRNDLFGDKGIKKALTLMKNENFKTQFIKQQGQNLYDILLNQINS
jgi:hypothetical protein